MARYYDRDQYEDKKKVGCCANMIRYLLFLFNGLFCLFGLIVFIAAAVLKWGNGSFNKIFNNKQIAEQLSTLGSLSSVSIAVMILGGAIFLFSLFGFLGAYFKVKCFLVMYEAIVVALFIAHFIAVLVLVFGASSIKKDYSKFLNQTVTNLKENDKYKTNCEIMTAISNVFDCCGYDGPNDFSSNATIAEECCKKEVPQSGCNKKSIDGIEKNAINLLIIPSAVILGIEFFVFITVPFLIGRV